MNSLAPEQKMYGLISVKQELDSLSISLNGIGNKVFDDLSLMQPRLEPAELGFIRTISYLYANYFEAGKVSVKFLKDLLKAYDSESGMKCELHYKLVNDLRTFSQHNLNLNEEHGSGIKENCENWFLCSSGTVLPVTEFHWQNCLRVILDEAQDFLTSLVICLRKLETDESRTELLARWSFKRTRHHPVDKFDKLIDIAANDMGRHYLDATAFRKKHHSKWISKLEALTDDYIFEEVAREMIEYEILSDARPPTTLNGKTLQEDLGIPPGPELGKLLEKMHRFIDQNPTMTKEQIYSYLKEQM